MKPLTNDELLWLLVDFDNTVCNNSGYPDFVPTTPLDGAKEALDELTAKGMKITIYTARAWSEYYDIEHWLDTNQIPHRRIICGKPLGKYIIDDRNLEFSGNWEEVLKKIK